MKAGLARFLWLWLPPLAIFLAGLRRAFLTGQADPWDWGVPAALLLAGAGLLLARWGWTTLTWATLAWVALGSAGMAMLFCAVAAARAPDPGAAIGLLLLALLAAFGGARLRPPSVSGVLLLLLAALLLWRGPAHPIQPVPDRPGLAVITGLPLFWDEAGRAGRRDAPIIAVLRTRFTVMPMDDARALATAGMDRLLLAQPRALTPVQLVAIDQWVRRGGTALVLADPLLRWPSDLPLGDRRRSPSISLLDPLLAHWGFHPDGAPKSMEIRHFLPDGDLLTLSGAQLHRGGLPAYRRIGRGKVLLLGDADPIDDRLWLADPAHPRDPRYWVADTPACIMRWLGGVPVPGDRRWMLEADDVQNGIRWALVAGTFWAVMGAILLRRERRGSRPGTKGEGDGVKEGKSG
ncbi:Gldg family protein [Sphingobium sp. HBC34]|uniref:Gldg family protein n=1 Tax=Sphingobium cyanobacteriorum TaxID=3063954 RepID=A0ABT8ZL12_9SPHN|nr:Gldg family protein [Sphingobium sp. HBC34]MDO7834669.1 Gldg family protein [Sphingobium sp. HBC34]